MASYQYSQPVNRYWTYRNRFLLWVRKGFDPKTEQLVEVSTAYIYDPSDIKAIPRPGSGDVYGVVLLHPITDGRPVPKHLDKPVNFATLEDGTKTYATMHTGLSFSMAVLWCMAHNPDQEQQLDSMARDTDWGSRKFVTTLEIQAHRKSWEHLSPR